MQPSLERKISRGLDGLLYFYRDRNDSKSGLASLFSTRFRNLVMIQRNPKKTKKKTFRRVAFYFRATALKFNLENKWKRRRASEFIPDHAKCQRKRSDPRSQQPCTKSIQTVTPGTENWKYIPCCGSYELNQISQPRVPIFAVFSQEIREGSSGANWYVSESWEDKRFRKRLERDCYRSV